MPQQQTQSPLEIQGAKDLSVLLPKNKYNDKNTMPTNENEADADPNGIGELGTQVDQSTRQNNLKFNKFNSSNSYPNF